MAAAAPRPVASRAYARLASVGKRVAAALERAADRVDVPREGDGVVVFLFHAFFERERDVEGGLVYPQEGLTPRRLETLLEHMLQAGYRFVDLASLDALPPGRYAVLTFDDGYANNLAVVPTVRRYAVPVTVFVPTANVDGRRRYWWDAVYAERRRRGVDERAIDRELEWLVARPLSFVEGYLGDEFGEAALASRGDVDRVLSLSELRELASEPLVSIGNHTVDHPVLPSLAEDEIREQLVASQRTLTSILGRAPTALAYPEGAYDDRVIRIAGEVGLTCAVTVEPVRECAPLDPSRRMQVGRFQLRRDADPHEQLRRARARPQIVAAGARVRRRLTSAA